MKLAVTVILDTDTEDETLTSTEIKSSVALAIANAMDAAGQMGYDHPLANKISILFDYVGEIRQI